MKNLLKSALLLYWVPSLCAAELLLPSFFSDGMVLQRETSAAIWGKGQATVPVRVEFAGQVVKSESDETGNWKVSLSGLESSAEGRELKITVGAEEKVIKDVVVGEVWIASGQSNMQWQMSKSDSAEYATTVNRPLVRQYVCGEVASETPQKDFSGRWVSAVGGAASQFSAVGFHFAEELSETLGVPVGIIELAWGGKPVEAFISEEVINSLPEAKPLREERKKLLEKYAKWLKNTKNPSEKQDEKKRKKKNLIHPKADPKKYSSIYNGMIAPVAGYSARGIIWYQGEANTNNETAELYAKFLQAMVADWRDRWGMELSFYQVQLANYQKTKKKAKKTAEVKESSWVVVQDQQRRSLEMIPQSGMAVIHDIGNPLDIHPRNKKDVGLRLARWAKFYDYGKNEVLYSGPFYKGVEFIDGTAILSFTYDEGLKSADGAPLKWFEVAGEDGKWVPAEAKVNGKNIVVRAEAVDSPVKVRYAWHETPEGANLTNASGLPASCFTSE